MSAIRTRKSPQTGLDEVFDPQRNKWVRMTPEEIVRQQFVNYLITVKHYPQGRIANEVPITVGKMSKRCDSIIYDQNGLPFVICEYKASSVTITQRVFDQIIRYNYALRVPYLMVSNGVQNYCCYHNTVTERFEFLSEIPDYQDLSQR